MNTELNLYDLRLFILLLVIVVTSLVAATSSSAIPLVRYFGWVVFCIFSIIFVIVFATIYNKLGFF